MKDISLKRRKVFIDVEAFIEDVRKIRRHQQEAELIFCDHSFHQISYEQLVKNQQKTMNGVFDLLNVPHRMTSTDLRKQNSETIEDLVLNYEEFKDKVSKTEFAHQLDD